MAITKDKESKMPIETVTIPKSSKEYLNKKIEKLNRKAAKLNCPLMILTFNNDHITEITHNPLTGGRYHTPIKIEMCDATLEYEIPMIAGYELIAKLDLFTGKNGDVVMVAAVPEKEVPSEYQNKTEIHCDHCGHNRRRNHSILIRHTETGEYKEVGSTCVKDFFGGNDPMGFMFYAELDFSGWCNKAADEFYGGGRWVHAYGLNEVLNITSAVIARFGWTSKTIAYQNDMESTADLVWENLEPSRDTFRNRREILVTVEEKDREIAKEAIKYFDENENVNDYVLNCKKLIELDYVPNRYMGYACSMVSSYLKTVEEKKNAEKQLPSNWVGEIGERLKDIHVECIFSRVVSSYYGESVLYTFRDANGNIYKTFYSGNSWSVDDGESVLITGTVKKHDEWKGQKQTMLNRVAVKDADGPVQYGMFTEDEFAVA